MLEISDHNYHRVVNGRNALGAALQRFVSASAAVKSDASDAGTATELAEAVEYKRRTNRYERFTRLALAAQRRIGSAEND